MVRSLALRLTFASLAVALLAASGALPPPPAPPAVRPVTETHFGATVGDPYRYFEDPKDPGLASYFKAQSTYTRAVLDALPGRAALARAHRAARQRDRVARRRRARGGTVLLREAAGRREHDAALRARRSPAAPSACCSIPTASRARRSSTTRSTTSRRRRRAVRRVRHLGRRLRENGAARARRAHGQAAARRDRARDLHRAVVARRRAVVLLLPHAAGRRPNQPQSEKDTKGVARLHVLGRDPDRDPAMFGYGRSIRDIPFAPEDAAIVSVSPRSRWAIARRSRTACRTRSPSTSRRRRPPRSAARAVAQDRRLRGRRARRVTRRRHAVPALAQGRAAAPHARAGLTHRNARDAHAWPCPRSARVIEDAVARRRRRLPARPRRRDSRRLRRLALRADGRRARCARCRLPFGGAIAASATDPIAPRRDIRAHSRGRNRRAGTAPRTAARRAIRACGRSRRSTTRRSRPARCSRRAPTGRRCRCRS